MGLFRAYRKFGGRLALFALALQFYLSFAHIHPDDIYGPVAKRCITTVNLPAAKSFKSIPEGQPWYSSNTLCPSQTILFFLSSDFLRFRRDNDLALTLASRAGPALGDRRRFLSRHALRSDPRASSRRLILPGCSCSISVLRVHAWDRHRSAARRAL